MTWELIHRGKSSVKNAVAMTILLSSQDNERETAENEETSQQNHNQVLTENDGYTEPHHNREPENTYISLNLYDNPDDNSSAWSICDCKYLKKHQRRSDNCANSISHTTFLVRDSSVMIW